MPTTSPFPQTLNTAVVIEGSKALVAPIALRLGSICENQEIKRLVILSKGGKAEINWGTWLETHLCSGSLGLDEIRFIPLSPERFLPAVQAFNTKDTSFLLSSVHPFEGGRLVHPLWNILLENVHGRVVGIALFDDKVTPQLITPEIYLTTTPR